MKITTTVKSLKITNNYLNNIFDGKSIFFDIETTGFSPKQSHLYLIGYAFRTKSNSDEITIKQLFAENYSEEKEILSIFLEDLRQFNNLISFNGVGFDIPYLKGKCADFGLTNAFDTLNYTDIFKEISSIKALLKLENYKQKTLEKFLQIDRDDIYSGGQLINIYKEYISNPKEESLDILLLHNFEDVIGMIDLLPVLLYRQILEGNCSYLGYSLEEYKDIHGQIKEELFITLENPYEIPQELTSGQASFKIHIGKNSTTIRIPVIQDELLFFYPNYKDYYYLPLEDKAIHKSVSSFVDKEYREPCKAYNCYTKRYGKYLPQPSSLISPVFKTDYKDKAYFFQMTEDILSNNNQMLEYSKQIFSLFYTNKNCLV